MKLIGFIKDWALVISMLSGIAGYFIFVSLPLPAGSGRIASETVSVVQPVLLFSMLFLTFCRLDVRKLHLRPWHKWLLSAQTGLFTVLGCILIALPQSSLRVVLEGAMLCLICPTATAGAVITRKLGGSVEAITTYTILINIANAILIPVLVPFVHPHPGQNIITSALLILGKVFPLLLMPLLSAMFVRRFMPALCRALCRQSDLSFYLWAVALALAIAVTVKSIMHSEVSVSTQLWLVAVSLACCLAQFRFGWMVGDRYGDHITAGQSMGQKNTVLVIWMGYTFFTPVTAIVGGFYSIWHNLINSWQLYRHNHRVSRDAPQESR